MLKKISLNNVRSFRDLKDFELKPITVLCGTNSSGKSTILKSILMWKQTLENLTDTDGFILNGKYTSLGSQEDLLNNNAKNKVIRFNFQFEFNFVSQDSNRSELEKFYSKLSLGGLYKIVEEEPIFNSATGMLVDFTLGYKVNSKKESGIEPKEYILKLIPVIDKSKAKVKSKGKTSELNGDFQNIECTELKISWVGKNKVHLEWKNIPLGLRVKPDSPAAANLSPKMLKLKGGDVTFSDEFFSSNILKFYIIQFGQDYDTHEKIIGLSNDFREFLINSFGNIKYLGPLREEPSRRYIYDDQVKDIGVKGENSAYLYNKYRSEQISYFIFDQIKEKFIEKTNTLDTAVRECLNEIGILDFESVKKEELHRFSLSSSEFNEGRVNIADVGFGVSQVVPIVIAGLLIDPSETLILEQPEIHLHPKMQMKLADFILSVPFSGGKLIIETHSEHLINRIVRRIVEDETGMLKPLIGINFVKNSDKGSEIEKVNLSENDGIENWPDEFFDQAAGEQQKIMNAIIKNKKKNESQ